MKRLILLSAALACLGLLSAHYPDWEYIANGDEVTGICQYQGQIWVSTSAGLCVVDPTANAISHLDKNDTGLPLGPLTDLTLDQNGTPWAIVPHFGTASYEGGAWNFHFLQTNHPAYWLLPWAVDKLRIGTDNRKWASFYRWQLIQADEFNFTPHPNPDLPMADITALHADPWNTVWAVFDGSYPTDFIALCAVRDSLQLTYINYLDYPFSQVNALAADAPEDLWLATNAGILRRAGDDWTWFDHLNSPLPHTGYTALTLDAQNSPVLGSADGWLVFRSGGDWAGISPAESGIGNKRIGHILIDGDGDWWIGTNNGLHRRSGGAWTYFPTSASALTHNAVGFIHVEDDGSVWMGGENGLELLQGDTVTSYTTDNSPLLGNTAKVLGRRGSELWIATNAGFNVISGDTWASHPFPELDQSSIMSYDIAFAPGGACWISTSDRGLFKYDGSGWTVLTSAQIPLPYLSLSGVEIDLQGRVWIASGSGAACLEGENWTVYNSDNSPLPDNRLRGLALAPSGYLWFATQAGLAAYTGSWWMTFTELTDGLPSNSLDRVWVDEAGSVWFHMALAGLGKTDGYSFEFMDAANSGLPDNSIYSLEQDAEGRYYFSSWHGLALWDPAGSAVNELIPPAAGTALRISPNPFRIKAGIGFHLRESGRAKLSVYNLRGQLVRELDLGAKTAGEHRIDFDGKDSSGQTLSSGVYLFQLAAPGQTFSGKALILK